MTPVDVVVMAAGKGTRMCSQVPKVLHRLAGRTLLDHVIDTVAALKLRRAVVVTGFGAQAVQASLEHVAAAGRLDLRFALQEPQLGTGHAVQQAQALLGKDGMVLILNGDVPLITAATLRQLLRKCDSTKLALLTVDMPEPGAYGRIVRAGKTVQAIVEYADASPEQRAICEVYSGVMAVPAKRIRGWLARLKSSNKQGEYYLTDLVALAVADGVEVVALKAKDPLEVEGINTPAQLAAMERALQLRLARAMMEKGVRLADPARLDIRGELVCARDVEIDVNCIFSGLVRVGEGARIGANCVISNAVIGAGAVIHPFTHIEGEALGVQVGAGALVGPFARLRPGAQLGEEVHIGNFVEVKNASLARGAKANHLAYLGDASLGERVNYGAGSITANYDGANKHRTVIEDDVHIGSNCVLVAPVTIGKGGTVGGGSTVTKSTAPGVLTVARAKQASIAGWKRPVKKR